jgi:uncharacterized protein (DUF2147 family)
MLGFFYGANMNATSKSNFHKNWLGINALLCIWLTLAAGYGFAQTEPSMLGKWRVQDGSVTVNIGPCGNAPDLCATVIEEQLAPGEKSTVGQIAVKGIRQDSKGVWRGKFLDGKDEIDASIMFKGNDLVEFKACAFLIFCETQRYTRTK